MCQKICSHLSSWSERESGLSSIDRRYQAQASSSWHVLALVAVAWHSCHREVLL